MVELLEVVASWPSVALVIAVFGFAPGFCLRLIVLAYPRSDPRRAELVAELYAVPRIQRPLWVAEQLEVALFEGLGQRVSAATRQLASRRQARPQTDRRNVRWLSLTLWAALAGAVTLVLALVIATGGTSTAQLPDVMHYGVVANASSNPSLTPLYPRAVPGEGSDTNSCDPTETVTFTFTIIARGSGTVHYIWRPKGDFSYLPVRNETITFTGPTQAKNIVYTVPLTGTSGQRIQGGMLVEVSGPGSFSGATYDQFEHTCS